MFQRILGINFFIGPPDLALKIGLSGGLVLVPAAPALVELQRDRFYRKALLSADLVITDSALMVLLWRLLKREKIVRLSGLEYLRLLLKTEDFRSSGNVAWIMPSEKSMKTNLSWLASQGFRYNQEDCYIAPSYPSGDINDPHLLQWLCNRNAKHIVIAIGGGTQERLGLSLQGALIGRPSIYCIGAAIGFLSGDQVRIPSWVDYLYIGWLFRCLSNPRRFIPRYMRALQLIPLTLKYKSVLPPFLE